KALYYVCTVRALYPWDRYEHAASRMRQLTRATLVPSSRWAVVQTEGRSMDTRHTGTVPALIATLFLIVALLPSTPGVAAGGPNTWTRIGSMTWPRSAFTATLLPNGRVLVAGGGVP